VNQEGPFCLNCKHHRLGRTTVKEEHTCLCPTGGVSLVTGRPLTYLKDCALMRMPGWPCGGDGVLFVPRTGLYGEEPGGKV
jgi:hypothetical protein